MSTTNTLWGMLAVSVFVGIGYELGRIADTLEEAHQAKVTLIADTPYCNRPCKCAPYYNLGTSEWRECMGVEYK